MSDKRQAGVWKLPVHVAASGNMLATFEREFARLRALEHPHIERLFELDSNGGNYYVTREPLDGASLRQLLTELTPQRLELGEADDVVRAVGSALVFAHERGVAHGNVRAENVVVTMDRRVVLTNFLARRVARGAVRRADEADDVKGLARLAAELYTGKTSPQAMPSRWHGVPRARSDAIRTVLEPTDRSSMGAADFLAAAGLGFGTRRPSATERPRRSASRGRWRLVLPVIAVAAVGGLVAAYLVGSHGPDPEASTPQDAPRTAPATPSETMPRRQSADLSATVAAVETEPPPAAADGESSPPAEPLVATDTAPLPAATPLAPAATATPAVAARIEAPVVSLGVTKIAAREDHSVVAIDVVRSGDTTREASVAWWAAPDTAHEDDDYADIGWQTVRFAAGATVERVLIPIVNDGVRESDEAFSVHLSGPSGGVAGVTTTRVTLHDDD